MSVGARQQEEALHRGFGPRGQHHHPVHLREQELQPRAAEPEGHAQAVPAVHVGDPDAAAFAAAAVTGNTGDTALEGDGPTKWDGKEWPVPYESYTASDGGGAAGTFIAPSSDASGAGTISAFRGPVF